MYEYKRCEIRITYQKGINMKVSLISTIYNEEYSIKEFLDGLLSQSYKPDEIIIVDGGSKDNTSEIVKSYIKKGAPIKFIVSPGVNIAKGRNIAIENSKNEIIASTDAGCKLDKDWLKNLIVKIEDDVDVVSGMTIPAPKNKFERCVAQITVTKMEDINENNYLPSSRSIAFKKSAWEKVGGYPEYLYTAEDTLFDLNMKEAGLKFVTAKDAIVYWDIRKNLKALFKQYYLYGRGNKEAGLVTLKGILNSFFNLFSPVGMLILLPYLISPYIIVFWLPPFLYIIKPYISDGLKCYRMDKKVIMFVYGILIKITVSSGWFTGMVAGKNKSKRGYL